MALLASASCWAQQTAAQLCATDLEAIPGILLENDTGAKAHLAQRGQKHFDDAMTEAREAAARVPDAAACEQLLRRYLKAWRKGHLGVRTVSVQETAASRGTSPSPTVQSGRSRHMPQLRVLSPQTLLLTLPSFANDARAPLLAQLAQHRAALASHRNWIVDVRGNGGGSDSTYEPLLAWLLSGETVTVGAEWLATAANIRGQEEACARFSPGDAECEAFTRNALARMRSVAPGSHVAQDEEGTLKFERVMRPEPRRPSRVAVLIDGECASSCEEFVLVARQSFSVKLVGRPTFGALDYSNLRPYELPSRQRVLFYATSRSLRLPDFAVDLGGIQPDVYLPLPAEEGAREQEIFRVWRWLEGGSLSPTAPAAAERQQPKRN